MVNTHNTGAKTQFGSGDGGRSAVKSLGEGVTEPQRIEAKSDHRHSNGLAHCVGCGFMPAVDRSSLCVPLDLCSVDLKPGGDRASNQSLLVLMIERQHAVPLLLDIVGTLLCGGPTRCHDQRLVLIVPVKRSWQLDRRNSSPHADYVDNDPRV